MDLKYKIMDLNKKLNSVLQSYFPILDHGAIVSFQNRKDALKCFEKNIEALSLCALNPTG